MPSFCAVFDCTDKYGHGQNVPFHKFPTKHKELLEKWIEFTQRSRDWRPSKWASICGHHFHDEDYRCLEQKKLLKKNAVPSVRTSQIHQVTDAEICKPITEENEKEQNACNVKDVSSAKEKPKANCRFCGIAAINFVSFAGNFEMFGMIQKCLPTLSICQDDNLPKELCGNCLKRLENFARFIDKVFETQATLLRQFRSEKGVAKSNERILKIKQEPVVRVKQENIDDVNAFFPDEVDDGCCGEQDNDVSNTETQLDQKFQFCDFPVLNDQDIINNCDIMEIINLSDPFIDITNCENTIAEDAPQQEQHHQNLQQTSIIQTQRQSSHFSAHELLQSHLLLEEHNYACAAEDFKEEWQIKNSYKTEKVEADDYEPDIGIEQSIIEDTGQDTNCISEQLINDSEVAATVTVETTSNTTAELLEENLERSNKPIVTSISAINEATILPFTNCASEMQTSSRKKPNIVVLNESIVQSSHTFQLQACTICQSKFLGMDSLNQHYATAHNAESIHQAALYTSQPMVSLPVSNFSSWNNNFPQDSTTQYPSYKIEKDIVIENSNPKAAIVDRSITNQNETENVPKRSSKNEIKILDMQQSFLQHEYLYDNRPILAQAMTNNIQQLSATTETFTTMPQLVPNTFDTDRIEQLRKKTQIQNGRNIASNNYYSDDYSGDVLSSINSKTVHESEAYEVDPHVPPNERNLERIAADYMALKKRYRLLQRKCRNLEHNTNSKCRRKKKPPLLCRICAAEFNTIAQLIRHKQSLASHHIRKPRTRYFGSCAGCEKFFSNKKALHNHMRFICQSLPLRWMKTPIRTFKCRYCRSITFTHWRLYRRHEVNCRRKRATTSRVSKLNRTNSTAPAQSENISNNLSTPKYNSHAKASTSKLPRTRKVQHKSQSLACPECKKVFPTTSSLCQHRITHSNLRVHQCEICKRVFKRRNGLTQHVRGFHMKFKPFECPTCKHCYALKSDMRRCKHSILMRSVGKTKKKEK